MHVLMIMLAQSATDISAVPADFVKWFFVMLAFVVSIGLAAFMAYRKGRQASGTHADPLNIAQPLGIKMKVEYALKEEVHEIRQNITRMIQAGNDQHKDVIAAVSGSERRLMMEVKDVHERLNPVAEASKAHEATLKAIQDRLAASEHARQIDTTHMQQRIDDAIRAASSKK